VSRAGVVQVELRAAVPSDAEPVWRWRNDPETRRFSFDPSAIPWDAHQQWFASTLARADRRLYVVVADGAARGVVRLDIAGDAAEVSIHLAPESRGLGVGTAALRAVADLAFSRLGIARLVGSIKPDNRPSLRAFVKAGFSLDGDAAVTTAVRVRP
jgi:RimJ/RimL family protein N-acetyltransferase